MLDEPHRSVVLELATTIPDAVAWALTGSTGMALQGVPLEPNDVDVQTDERGVDAIEARFEEAIEEPVSVVESESIRSRLGRLTLQGVDVELIGAMQKRRPDGTWEPPVDVTDHRTSVSLDGTTIPVLSLEYEQRAYRRLGRDDRADLLAAYVDESDADG